MIKILTSGFNFYFQFSSFLVSMKKFSNGHTIGLISYAERPAQ
jgi:hypothetical protein